MTTGKKFFTAAAGLLALSATGPAFAAGAGSYSYSPGQVSYNYSSPLLSAYGSLQIGGSPSANVTQTSANNAVIIGQYGAMPSISVHQSGQNNQSSVLQISFSNAQSLLGF